MWLDGRDLPGDRAQQAAATAEQDSGARPEQLFWELPQSNSPPKPPNAAAATARPKSGRASPRLGKKPGRLIHTIFSPSASTLKPARGWQDRTGQRLCSRRGQTPVLLAGGQGERPSKPWSRLSSLSPRRLRRARCAQRPVSPTEKVVPKGHHPARLCDTGRELATTAARCGTKPTYHFIIDFVEMDFTDFFHHVFIFKSYEAKSCFIKKQKGEGERKILG